MEVAFMMLCPVIYYYMTWNILACMHTCTMGYSGVYFLHSIYYNEGSMVLQYVVLVPQIYMVCGSSLRFCVFPSSPCGFPVGIPVYYHLPETCW